MNAKRFIIFQIVIMQHSRNVKQAKTLGNKLQGGWTLGKKANSPCSFRILNKHWRVSFLPSKEERSLPSSAPRFSTGAVRYLTDRGKGGILLPNDVDKKLGDSVTEALESKHPHARIPDASSLPEYTNTPDFVDAVKKVARRLSGSAGLGGTDSHALQHWLLQFGVASRKLCTALAEFTEWLSKDFLPWPGYRAIMARQLVALDKCPGI
jgi:hypothetical protein